MTASPQAALTGLRVVVALLILIHGVARVVAGGVDPFGAWLSSIGFPLGRPLAWLITIVEIVGTPALVAGILVRPLSLSSRPCSRWASRWSTGWKGGSSWDWAATAWSTVCF